MSVNLNSITPVGPGWKRLPSVHRGYPRWCHESGVEAELYRDEGNGYLWAADLWACEDGAEEEAWALIRAAFHQQRAPEAPEVSNDDIPQHLLYALRRVHTALQDDTVRSLSTTNEYLQPIVDAALSWREKAVEQARRQGQLDVLRLGADTPFWLLEVFKRLLAIADRACGAEDRATVEAGEDLLAKMLDILEATTAAEAEAGEGMSK